MIVGPGTNLGRYRLVEKLGQGGMATVYRAYQPSLDREVAIKVLPYFYADDPAYLERFKQEARAIARLDHPNILHVYDYGEESGVTYIASQFVSGGTLARKLGSPLPLPYLLSLLRPVASALDYAHSRGIVHRDVKPSNILLTLEDTPILSDFGIAKMVGGTRLTESGLTVGTPEYMAPEQAMGEGTAACDLYALGVVLYEMATGRVPFSAETPMAVVLAHMHSPLPLPRTLNPDLSEAVQSVILKALAKQPEDRFSSATQMVEALEKAMASAPAPGPATGQGEHRTEGRGAPVQAALGPAVLSADGALALPREAKGLRRLLPLGLGLRPAALALVAAVLLAGGAMLWLSQRGEDPAAGRQSASSLPTTGLPPTGVEASASGGTARPMAASPTGMAASPPATSLPSKPASASLPANLPSILTPVVPARTPPSTSTPASPTAPASETRTPAPPKEMPASNTRPLISAENASRVDLRAVPTDSHGMVNSLAFSPDGRFLASAQWGLRVFDASSGRSVRWWGPPPPGARTVAYSPDGKTLAFGAEEHIVSLVEVVGEGVPVALGRHGDKVMSVALAPDGETMASGSMDNTAKLWDVKSRKELRSLSHTRGVQSVGFSPDGKTLATAYSGPDDPVRLWEVSSGRQLRAFGKMGDVPAKPLAFSPDGKTLAVGYTDSVVRLWDAATGSMLRALGTPESGVWVGTLAFSPDGKLLVSGNLAGKVKIWEVGSGRDLRTLTAGADEILSVAFSPDGGLIASGSRTGDQGIKLWAVASP